MVWSGYRSSGNEYWCYIFIYFANYFLKEIVREKFLNRFKNLEIKFKKSEFNYLLLYRFIGGIPWQLSCVLPTMFNVKILNFFSNFNWYHTTDFFSSLDWFWFRKSD